MQSKVNTQLSVGIRKSLRPENLTDIMPIRRRQTSLKMSYSVNHLLEKARTEAEGSCPELGEEGTLNLVALRYAASCCSSGAFP